jgi:hypothetical protein
MASLNPEALPEDMVELLTRVIEENPDPWLLAVAVWNLSWDATQGVSHASDS